MNKAYISDKDQPEFIKQQKVNMCLNLVRISNRKLNMVRSSEGESAQHIFIKERICKQLKADGHPFLTEAIFNMGGRPDIFVLDQFKIIEIAVTESDASLKAKARKYPAGLAIEVVRQ